MARCSAFARGSSAQSPSLPTIEPESRFFSLKALLRAANAYSVAIEKAADAGEVDAQRSATLVIRTETQVAALETAALLGG